MSGTEEFRSPEEIWQTTENLKLVQKFFRYCTAHPECRPDLSRGGTHVLVPPDEPGYARLREANLRFADKLMHEGSEFDYWLMNADGSAEVVSSQAGAALGEH